MSAPAALVATEPAAPGPTGCGVPTINPLTGLSTDYLNHFTEVVMMLEMAGAIPEYLDDLKAWRPKTYVEHFKLSAFSGRDAVIGAYQAADPARRRALDEAAATLNSVLAALRDTVVQHIAAPTVQVLARRTLAGLQPLIADVAAVINGTAIEGPRLQASIDAMFRR